MKRTSLAPTGYNSDTQSFEKNMGNGGSEVYDRGN